MYTVITAQDHLVPPPTSATTTTSCSSGPACSIVMLSVEPNRKPQPASWSNEAPINASSVVPAADSRFHVPLERDYLKLYSLVVTIAEPQLASAVVVNVWRYLCLACRGGNFCGKCATPFTTSVDPAEKVQIPLTALDLTVAGAPFLVEARLIPKTTAHATIFARTVYVDNDEATFGIEFEFIRDEYLKRMSSGVEPTDKQQYPLIKRDIISWYDAPAGGSQLLHRHLHG